MNSVCYEVSVRFSAIKVGAEETLKQIFFQAGFDETSLIVTIEGRYAYLKVYCNAKQTSRKIVQCIDGLMLKGVKVFVKKLGVADWRDKWKEDIRPFRLTDRFDVVPSWNMKGYKVGRREPIFLDTTLAFGTGLHETTRFAAQLIEKYSQQFETFLDIGTGTGLLAIIAQRCGARELWAVDIDECSIRTARKNCARNGVEIDWCKDMDFRKFRHKKQFDFVAANIITDELIDLKEKILRVVSPGGYLAVSGISLGNLSRFKKAFKSDQLRCLRILKGKKWVAILYKKL